MTKLTKTELLEMENLNLEKNLEERDEQILILNKNIEMLNTRVRQLESQTKASLIDKKIATKKDKVHKLKEAISEFNNKIKKKYKIKDGFGINPDTGEITLD